MDTAAARFKLDNSASNDFSDLRSLKLEFESLKLIVLKELNCCVFLCSARKHSVCCR